MHEDIALTQLAQLFMRNIDWTKTDGDGGISRPELDGIERILSIAMQTGLHEV
jgi:hypothetical protein